MNCTARHTAGKTARRTPRCSYFFYVNLHGFTSGRKKIKKWWWCEVKQIEASTPTVPSRDMRDSVSSQKPPATQIRWLEQARGTRGGARGQLPEASPSEFFISSRDQNTLRGAAPAGPQIRRQ